eukprot:5651144-Pleurochrysis_carterae.AAC.1
MEANGSINQRVADSTYKAKCDPRELSAWGPADISTNEQITKHKKDRRSALNMKKVSIEFAFQYRGRAKQSASPCAPPCPSPETIVASWPARAAAEAL